MRRKNIAIILSLIVILGGFLRFYKLDSEGIDVVELCSLQMSQRDLSGGFFETIAREKHAPIYYIILQFWLRLFWSSEFILRLLSVIFGVASIFLIYKVGEVLFNRELGLLSAFLLSVSNLHIFYSQYARPYSLLVLLVMISTFLFIKALNESKFKYWFFYVLLTTLVLYTHNFGVFVLLSQGTYFIIFITKFKNSVKKWLIAQIVIFLTYLPWVIRVFNQFSQSENIRWIPKASFPLIMQTFIDFSTGRYLGTHWLAAGVSESINTAELSVLLIFAVLFFLGVISVKRENLFLKEKSEIIFAILWLFIPMFFSFIVAFILFPIYVTRYILFTLPAYYILVAKGISNLRIKQIQVSILLMISFFNFFILKSFYAQPHRVEHFRESVRYIEEHIKENEVIFALGQGSSNGFLHYYSGVNEVVDFEISPRPRDKLLRFKKEIKDKDGIWLFSLNIEANDKLLPLMTKMIKKKYFKKSGKVFSGSSINYYVLEKKNNGKKIDPRDIF